MKTIDGVEIFAGQTVWSPFRNEYRGLIVEKKLESSSHTVETLWRGKRGGQSSRTQTGEFCIPFLGVWIDSCHSRLASGFFANRDAADAVWQAERDRIAALQAEAEAEAEAEAWIRTGGFTGPEAVDNSLRDRL